MCQLARTSPISLRHGFSTTPTDAYKSRVTTTDEKYFLSAGGGAHDAPMTPTWHPLLVFIDQQSCAPGVFWATIENCRQASALLRYQQPRCPLLHPQQS
jgi:hypothetical protein